MEQRYKRFYIYKRRVGMEVRTECLTTDASEMFEASVSISTVRWRESIIETTATPTLTLCACTTHIATNSRSTTT